MLYFSNTSPLLIDNFNYLLGVLDGAVNEVEGLEEEELVGEVLEVAADDRFCDLFSLVLVMGHQSLRIFSWLVLES